MNKKDYPQTPAKHEYECFKMGEKYGIEDELGRVVVEPVFENVYIHQEAGIVEFTLDGKHALWPLKRIREL